MYFQFKFKKLIYLLSLLLILVLFGCAQNVFQVWVGDLDQEVRPESLKNEKQEIIVKNDVNYLKEKKIFIFSHFAKSTVPPEFLKKLAIQSENFFKNKWSNEKNIKDRDSFLSKNTAFLEDFLTSFRVNKDLANDLSKNFNLDILLIPQVVFWSCDSCDEEKLLHLRLSLVDLKLGRLIWFADNFHEFSEVPDQQVQIVKGLELYQVLLREFQKAFIK